MIKEFLAGRKLKSEYAGKKIELDIYERELENIEIWESENTDALRKLKSQLRELREKSSEYFKLQRIKDRGAFTVYTQKGKTVNAPRLRREFESSLANARTALRECLSEIYFEESCNCQLDFDSVQYEIESTEHRIRNLKAERDALLRKKQGVKNNIAHLIREMQLLQNQMSA